MICSLFPITWIIKNAFKQSIFMCSRCRCVQFNYQAFTELCNILNEIKYYCIEFKKLYFRIKTFKFNLQLEFSLIIFCRAWAKNSAYFIRFQILINQQLPNVIQKDSKVGFALIMKQLLLRYQVTQMRYFSNNLKKYLEKSILN